MRISDWSSDVCSSDLIASSSCSGKGGQSEFRPFAAKETRDMKGETHSDPLSRRVVLLHGIWMVGATMQWVGARLRAAGFAAEIFGYHRSEEHTSELQSLMRTSYAVFCLKNKKTKK